MDKGRGHVGAGETLFEENFQNAVLGFEFPRLKDGAKVQLPGDVASGPRRGASGASGAGFGSSGAHGGRHRRDGTEGGGAAAPADGASHARPAREGASAPADGASATRRRRASEAQS